MSEVQRFWCHEAQNLFCVRASDYDALAAQRDEGLAREAELREQLAAETAYYRSTLRNVLKDIRDDIARGGLAPSWSGVAETISIVLNVASTNSPGGADAQKTSAPALNIPRRKVKTEYSTPEEDAQADAWNAALDAVQELNR